MELVEGRPLSGLLADGALELDRFNDLFQALFAIDLYFARRYDEAIVLARTALRTTPRHPAALVGLWLAGSRAGHREEALAAAKGFLDVCYADSGAGEALGQGSAAGGYPEGMRRAAMALAAQFPGSYVAPGDIAQFFAEAGEGGQSLEWLERAFEVRDPNLPYIGMPAFDDLRSDPRYQALRQRLKLVPPS